MSEAEKLFEKRYNCPICDNKFTSKTVKTGKSRLLRTDIDLRNVYEDIEPLKYDVVLCQNCGYCALAKFFPLITNIQKKHIREKITPHFKPIPDEGAVYTYEQAITRYNIAYANAAVKMAKASEGAYISLKTAWLYRSYKESLSDQDADYKSHYDRLDAQETEWLRKAYDGFIKAVQSEDFPICGMDETTIDFLISVLAMQFKEYATASKLLGNILTSHSASSRVKDKARDVKEELVKKMKEEEEAGKNGYTEDTEE